MKSCGGCTLCCYFMGVPIFDSPEYSYCPNCDQNKGCKIWETRPDICRNTSCVWFVEPDIPIKYRPDQCGFMFERPPHSDLYVGHVDPARHEVWNSRELAIFVEKIKQTGHSVVLCSFDQSQTIYSLAKGDTIERVKKDLLECVRFHRSKEITE